MLRRLRARRCTALAGQEQRADRAAALRAARDARDAPGEPEKVELMAGAIQIQIPESGLMLFAPRDPRADKRAEVVAHMADMDEDGLDELVSVARRRAKPCPGCR